MPTPKSTTGKCETCGTKILIKLGRGGRKRFCSKCFKKRQRENARKWLKTKNGRAYRKREREIQRQHPNPDRYADYTMKIIDKIAEERETDY